jgi:hypothetical protein
MRTMNRRAFLRALSGSLIAAPLAAEAQSAGKVWRIGFLVHDAGLRSGDTRAGVAKPVRGRGAG